MKIDGRLIWWADGLIRRAEIKVYFHGQMPGEHRKGRWHVYARVAAFNSSSPSWHPDLCLQNCEKQMCVVYNTQPRVFQSVMTMRVNYLTLCLHSMEVIIVSTSQKWEQELNRTHHRAWGLKEKKKRQWGKLLDRFIYDSKLLWLYIPDSIDQSSQNVC